MTPTAPSMVQVATAPSRTCTANALTCGSCVSDSRLRGFGLTAQAAPTLATRSLFYWPMRPLTHVSVGNSADSKFMVDLSGATDVSRFGHVDARRFASRNGPLSLAAVCGRQSTLLCDALGLSEAVLGWFSALFMCCCASCNQALTWMSTPTTCFTAWLGLPSAAGLAQSQLGWQPLWESSLWQAEEAGRRTRTRQHRSGFGTTVGLMPAV